MAKSYQVTSAGLAPAEDRARRMRFYFLAMSLRVLCVASLFFVRGWWVLLVGAGAVILPYLAVMIANAVATGGDEARPEAPSPLELAAGDSAPEPSAAAETVIVVDTDPVRSSEAEGDAKPLSEAEGEDA